MKKGGQSCREKGYLIYIGKGSENEKNTNAVIAGTVRMAPSHCLRTE